MSKRDFYEILGVEKSTDPKDIKKAYRRVAMKFHPDRNPDDPKAEDKFKEATEAYDVLMDAEKREAYDRFGHAGVDASMGGGGGAGGNFSDVFGDVFGDIFGGGGGGRGRGGPQRGSDLRYTLDISLEDAVRGTTVEIRVPALAGCDTCDGSGAAKGSKPTTCGTCGGAGQVRMQQGFFQVQQTCCSTRFGTVSTTLSSRMPRSFSTVPIQNAIWLRIRVHRHSSSAIPGSTISREVFQHGKTLDTPWRVLRISLVNVWLGIVSKQKSQG